MLTNVLPKLIDKVAGKSDRRNCLGRTGLVFASTSTPSDNRGVERQDRISQCLGRSPGGQKGSSLRTLPIEPKIKVKEVKGKRKQERRTAAATGTVPLMGINTMECCCASSVCYGPW